MDCEAFLKGRQVSNAWIASVFTSRVDLRSSLEKHARKDTHAMSMPVYVDDLCIDRIICLTRPTRRA